MDSAAEMRSSVIISIISYILGNALVNNIVARTLSKASWKTLRMRGLWTVNIALLVPGTRIRSVSAGHVGCDGPGTMTGSMGASLPPLPCDVATSVPVGTLLELAADEPVVGGELCQIGR
jgi:hypothetical protein